MRIPRHIFREYDIRGIADRDLDDNLVWKLGRGFAEVLTKKLGASSHLKVAVGRDARLSSPRLFQALTQGLMEGGIDVVDVGIGPTPLLYFAAHHLKSDGAVMITASHNPGPDNGFKLMIGRSSFYGEQIQALANSLETQTFESASRRGTLSSCDLEADYVEFVRASSRIPHTNVRFVIDAGNGAAGPLGKKTLEALGFSPEALFCDMDGTFPNHHPDPTVPKNLEALRKRVLETGSSLGIAWDGDGDRIGAVDDEGNVIWGDKLLILFARGVLAEHPGSMILGEVKCSETLYADIEKHGGKPVVWKTGHSLIKSKMKESGAKLAGEMSGHMFFADRYPGYDDAIYATVRLLEIVAREGKSLRELLSDVPQTYATPELRVDCDEAIKFDVVKRVLDHFRKTHKVIDIDGARIEFGGGAWGLCRASNTGAVLVLRFEARSESERDRVRQEVETVVRGAMAAASS